MSWTWVLEAKAKGSRWLLQRPSERREAGHGGGREVGQCWKCSEGKARWVCCWIRKTGAKDDSLVFGQVSWEDGGAIC